MYKNFYKNKLIVNSLNKQLNKVYNFKSNEAFKVIDHRLFTGKDITTYMRDTRWKGNNYPDSIITKQFTGLGNVKINFRLHKDLFIYLDITVSSLKKFSLESWSCRYDIQFSKLLYMLDILTEQLSFGLLEKKNNFSNFNLSTLWIPSSYMF